MTIGRVLGLLVLVVVLYSVISQPSESAAMTRNGAGHLADAGTSLTTFLSELTAGESSTDSGSDPVSDSGTTSDSDSGTTSGTDSDSGTTSGTDSDSGTTSGTDSDRSTGQPMPRGGVDTGDGSTR